MSEVGGKRLDVVVDFLDAWRFCPVSGASSPTRSCLEDEAAQLLDALDKAPPEQAIEGRRS